MAQDHPAWVLLGIRRYASLGMALCLAGWHCATPRDDDGAKAHLAPPRASNVGLDPNAAWGAPAGTVQRVSSHAAEALWSFLPPPTQVRVIVGSGNKVLVHHQRTEGGAFRIDLTAKGHEWARLTYQLSHELCHVSLQYDRDPHSHRWLEESVCEAASMRSLVVAADGWARKPPLSHSAEYHLVFRHYRRRVQGELLPLTQSESVDWFSAHRQQLARSPYNRGLNRRVALSLLSLVGDDRGKWEAFLSLNEGTLPHDSSFEAFLIAWSERVDAHGCRLVVSISEMLLGAKQPVSCE